MVAVILCCCSSQAKIVLAKARSLVDTGKGMRQARIHIPIDTPIFIFRTSKYFWERRGIFQKEGIETSKYNIERVKADEEKDTGSTFLLLLLFQL